MGVLEGIEESTQKKNQNNKNGLRSNKKYTKSQKIGLLLG